MKLYAINGSPRKGWNTDTMLRHFLDGAASVSKDLETETVHLYDLNYKGCISCFACQRNNDATYGQCQVRDDIYQLLRDVPQADGIVFGSPIYFHDLSAGLRAFLERLIYQYISFDKNRDSSNAPKQVHTAMIYTMNVTENAMRYSGYDHIVGAAEEYLYSTFRTRPERICAHYTYQFTDYAQYRAGYWDEEQKAAHRRDQFPEDCRAAFEAGKRMAEKIMQNS